MMSSYGQRGVSKLLFNGVWCCYLSLLKHGRNKSKNKTIRPVMSVHDVPACVVLVIGVPDVTYL